jgi:hypothetical protein
MLQRIAGLALALMVAAPAVGSAQYFGKNKVQWTSFDFKIIQTEHFDVYFYEREREAAMDAARMAERSYARLSRIMNHRFKNRKPIILYASHSDFQQTNALAGDINEATGGVTDFLKHRAIMPFTGSYAEFEHVLTHEMVHQFQYDIWSDGKPGAGLARLIAINPPLWFVEGMAEYLSLGEVGPETAMWLRDASVEGTLPSIQALTFDPYIFPYRFGHALMAYIGDRWGDEAIGALLKTTITGGVEGAFHRVLGISTAQLSAQWRDYVQKTYLPELGDRQTAASVADPLLTMERSGGTLHVAPALSPDGSKIAYLSEKDFYFVDMYLADGVTGEVKRRLVKSTFDSNYETFRYLNASSSWSPDGELLALAAKRGAQDDLVLLNDRGKEVARLKIGLNGLTNPSWSPDGGQLVFSGNVGGISDLYIINRDGTGLTRLTNDKFADLQPDWSPDGSTIAFVTDRGPDTDFNNLRFGNFRIALYHLETGRVEVLPQMEHGKNISPQWAPDSRSIALVSDRTGISNLYLYDLDDRALYQLTNFYTGSQSATAMSPVLTWARQADRLAFVYYSAQRTSVYSITDPRKLKGAPYTAPSAADSALADFAAARTEPIPGGELLPRRVTPVLLDPAPALDSTAQDTTTQRPEVLGGGSIYRTARGFRAAGEINPSVDSVTPDQRPLDIEALLDSADYHLPDTTQFSVNKYKPKLAPEYVARPTIGYTRDNFGNGFYGGSTIVLGDMLGNHRVVLSAAINGRIKEASVYAAYFNMSRRINWGLGASQQPYFYAAASDTATALDPDNILLRTNTIRIIQREVFANAYRPFNRFKRLELGLGAVHVNEAVLSFNQPVLRSAFPSLLPTGQQPFTTEETLDNSLFFRPSVAIAFDNTLHGYIAPFYGGRYRFEISQAIGGWQYTQGLADFRRYDGLAGPVILATRVLYWGQFGRDAGRFNAYIGTPDLVRGHTSGSYYRNECRVTTVCPPVNRLVGNQIAVATAEIRFPILSPAFGFLPPGIPPVEGAIWGDVGIAWDENSTLALQRRPGDDLINVRTPATAVGLSLRTNIFGIMILRADWAFPLDRRLVNHYWTISFGPAF